MCNKLIRMGSRAFPEIKMIYTCKASDVDFRPHLIETTRLREILISIY